MKNLALAAACTCHRVRQLVTLASSLRTEVELMLLVTGSVTTCTLSRCCHSREPSCCSRLAASVLPLQTRAGRSPACVLHNAFDCLSSGAAQPSACLAAEACCGAPNPEGLRPDN